MKTHTFSRALVCLAMIASMTACSTSTLTNMQPEQRNGAIIGAVSGTMAMTLLDAPIALTLFAAAAGAGIGYYLNIPHLDTTALTNAGGHVFKQGEYITLVIPNDVIFEADSDTFLASAKPILIAARDIIAQYPRDNILIAGNTDGVGSPEHEYQLSTHQAAAVASFLWSHNIQLNDSDRSLHYSGLSHLNPTANQHSAKGLAANRRIEIMLYPTSVKGPRKAT